MKKYVITLTSIILGMICCIGINNKVYADDFNDVTNYTSFSTYYPHGVEDYVDLNNLKAFTLSPTHFYYAVETANSYELNRYNLETKLHENLKSYEKSFANDIKSLKFVNNQLFVLNGTTLHVFNDDNFENDIVNLTINGEFGTINYPYAVKYQNNKYVFAIIKNISQTKQSLNLFYYSNLQTTHTKSLPLELDYQIINIAMNDNYLYIVGNDKLIHIYDVTDIDTLVEHSNSGTHTPTIIENMYDIDAFTFDDNNYIAITHTHGFNIYNSSDFTKSNGSLTSTQVSITSPKLLNVYQSDETLTAYVYDSDNSNIQKLQMNYVDGNTGFNLQTPNIVLAGKGTTLGRFDESNSIVLKNDKTLFVSDKNNNRIQIIGTNSIKAIDLETAYASNLVLDAEHNLIFLKHGTSGVYLSGYKYSNGNFDTKLFEDKALSSTTNSMCLSLSGKVYLLDYANKTICVLNNYDGSFDSITLSTISPNENSKIQYSNTFSEIILNVDNVLYRIATDSGVVNNTTLTFEHNIDHFEIDFSNNIYALAGNKLYKSTFADGTTECVTLNYECSYFGLNQVNGKFYTYNNGKSCFEIVSNEDFSKGLIEFPHDNETIFNSTAYASVLKYAILKNNVFVYNTINYVGEFYHSGQGKGTNVIILQQNLSQDASFVRVGYVDNNSINIGYVRQTDINLVNDPYVAKTHNLRTTNKAVSVFKYPTLASNVVVDTIDIGQPLTAIGTYSGSFESSDNFFYIVETNGKIGYVYSGDVISNVSVSTKHETNAEIRILDHSKGVYLYSEADENSPKILISDNQRIYVKNYSKTHTFTLVSYVDDEHIEHVGYVYTKYIKMDGVSKTFVTAIILFSLTLVLGVTLLIFYLSYKKKQAQHEVEQLEENLDEDIEIPTKRNKPELIDESDENDEE